ncbi:MAG: corrinoid protein [Spirochaetes bacterium]|nr:corrinoid protein [Spirochaetota bacterium]
MGCVKEIAGALIAGDADEVKKFVKAAVEDEVDPQTILDQGLIAGMDVIGAKFKASEIYVPEVLVSARAMHSGMELLEPLLAKTGVRARGTVVIGTVKGDLHDIGKNLVCMMLKGAGWKVVDIGVDQPAESFVETAQKEDADVIGMSALLTTTMVNMKQVVELATIKDCNAKIMIGGAPLTQSFADEIGAQGYAPDAATAVEVANGLL